MLMSANDGRIDEHRAKSTFLGQGCEHLVPDKGARPTRKALVGAVPQRELRRQIAPGTTGTCDPQHHLDKPAIVCAAASTISLLAGEQRFDLLPLFITKLFSYRHPNQYNRLEQHYELQCQQTPVRLSREP